MATALNIWQASVDEEAEQACITVLRDAGFITQASGNCILANRELIEEARERLNDALAKVCG